MRLGLGAHLTGRVAGVAGLGAILLVTGCTAGSAGGPSSVRAVASSPAAVPRVQFRVSPGSGAHGVSPVHPVTISARHGVITSATLATARGKSVPGTFNAEHTTWTSSRTLGFATTYRVSAVAVDGAKRRSRLSSSFTTVRPKATTYPSVIPLEGETVGVGIPIIIYWSSPVHNRAAAERLLRVTADKPITGAWHWYSDTEVHFRPRHFWPAYTHVTVHIGVGGRNLGDGVFGQTSRAISFTVGSSMISRVSNARHEMTISRNGKVIKRMPVALGLPATPTSSGTMVFFEKYKAKYFDSSTFGVPRNAPGGYYEKVYWDSKYTFGGEYVHAAPWSVVEQGHANASHGCVNVSTANARWFYYHTKRGDVIEIHGTRRHVRPGDGWTDWDMSWSQWLAGSALHH